MSEESPIAQTPVGTCAHCGETIHHAIFTFRRMNEPVNKDMYVHGQFGSNNPEVTTFCISYPEADAVPAIEAIKELGDYIHA